MHGTCKITELVRLTEKFKVFSLDLNENVQAPQKLVRIFAVTDGSYD